MKNFKNLIVYKKAFALAMDIYEISKRFPKEELYCLTGQIRKSSRSVCSCLAEAYGKRKYPAYFSSKITDSDMENAETDVWIDFARACNHITQEEYLQLIASNDEIGKLLGSIIKNPEKYL